MKLFPMTLAGMMALTLSAAPAVFADEPTSTDMKSKDSEVGLTIDQGDKDQNLKDQDLGKTDMDKPKDDFSGKTDGISDSMSKDKPLDYDATKDKDLGDKPQH